MERDESNYFDKFDTYYSDEKFYEFNSRCRNIYQNNYSATTSRMTGLFTKHYYTEDHTRKKSGITKEFTPRFSKTLGLG